MTFLATDVVGSTERIAQIGDREWRRVLDRHDQLIRRHLDEFGGRELGSAGDGFLAAFSRPTSAIACAAAIRSSLAGIHLRIRAGIHTGACEIRRDRFAGMTLHITARVSATAGSSEIFVTKRVTDLVAGANIEFEDVGAHELRGVPGTWQLLAVKKIDARTSHASRRVQRDWIQRSDRSKLRWLRVLLVTLLFVVFIAAGRILSNPGPDPTSIAAALSAKGTLAQTQPVRSGFELQLQPQGRSPQKIAGHYAVLRSLVWSDDGCLLAFAAGDSADLVHVFVVDPPGNLTKVTRSPADFRVLDWSADRKSLLVSSSEVVGGGLHSIEIKSEKIAETRIGTFDSARRAPPALRRC